MAKFPVISQPLGNMPTDEERNLAIDKAIDLLQTVRYGEQTINLTDKINDFMGPGKSEIARRVRAAKKRRRLERAIAEWSKKSSRNRLPEVPAKLNEDRRKKRLLAFTGDLTPATASAGNVQGETAPTQSLVDVQPLPRITDSANNGTTQTFEGPRPTTSLHRRNKSRLATAAASIYGPSNASSWDLRRAFALLDFCPDTQLRRKVTNMAETPTTPQQLSTVSLDVQDNKLYEGMVDSPSSTSILGPRRIMLAGLSQGDIHRVRV